MNYKTMTVEELKIEKKKVIEDYNFFKTMNINLTMARGIPNKQMVDISASKFSKIDVYSNRIYKDNTDLGNYNQGLIAGIKETKELFSELLDVDEKNLIIGGNSSLNLMFDLFSQLMLHGNCDSEKPWSKEDGIKFLCPVPGYDRHFAICEYMNVQMINIPMTDDGPDMDTVEALVKEDAKIKGIWCVPLYSNPSGIMYSSNTVKRLSSMKTAAKDFRIFWDNAYSVHHLYENTGEKLLNIIMETKIAGNANRVYMFASTSKITIPGSGIAVIATSEDNIEDILNRMKKQTIGYDKLNMIRHSIAFPNKKSVYSHMKEIADILRPNFDNTLDILDKELKELDIASWSTPKGGYFISFNAPAGCAKRIVELCAKAGVKLTDAGATYPYKNDSEDSSIRLAPTYPSKDEMITAAKVFCTCVKYASIEKLMREV